MLFSSGATFQCRGTARRYYLAGGQSSEIVGYCFYHRQDMEAALTDRELYLAFGDIQGGTHEGVTVGKRIRTADKTGNGVSV